MPCKKRRPRLVHFEFQKSPQGTPATGPPGLYQYAHDPARSDRAGLVWPPDSRRPESTHTFDLEAREPLWIVSLHLDMNKRLAIERADEAAA